MTHSSYTINEKDIEAFQRDGAVCLRGFSVAGRTIAAVLNVTWPNRRLCQRYVEKDDNRAAFSMTIATGSGFQSFAPWWKSHLRPLSLPPSCVRNRHSSSMIMCWSRNQVRKKPRPGIRTFPTTLSKAARTSVSGYQWTRCASQRCGFLQAHIVGRKG